MTTETMVVRYYSCACGNHTYTAVNARHVTCMLCGPMNVEEVSVDEAKARMAIANGKSGMRPSPVMGKARKAASSPATDPIKAPAVPVADSGRLPTAVPGPSPSVDGALTKGGRQSRAVTAQQKATNGAMNVVEKPHTGKVEILQATLFDGLVAHNSANDPKGRKVG